MANKSFRGQVSAFINKNEVESFGLEKEEAKFIAFWLEKDLIPLKRKSFELFEKEIDGGFVELTYEVPCSGISEGATMTIDFFNKVETFAKGLL